MNAKFIGVGVGPGDPELITVKAWRLIQQADVISYIVNTGGDSQAKRIATQVLSEVKKPQKELPVIMPMCEDRQLANGVYDEAAEAIKCQLQENKIVVFLCEGDPLFFGSFAYLLERLQHQFPCQAVPGISSVHAAASAILQPLTMLQESFAVISGRHSDEKICNTLNNYDSIVILKAGKSRQRILRALTACKRTDDACYLEYISRYEQHIETDIMKLTGETGPYFSLFLVTRQNRKCL